MTETTDTHRSLPLLGDPSTDTNGCGCGGCGCDAADTDTGPTPAQSDSSDGENPGTTHSYPVAGMTCGHCAQSVISELKPLDGVTDVRVKVVPGGTSTVTVTSDAPLDDGQVAAALELAGGYQLAHSLS